MLRVSAFGLDSRRGAPVDVGIGKRFVDVMDKAMARLSVSEHLGHDLMSEYTKARYRYSSAARRPCHFDFHLISLTRALPFSSWDETSQALFQSDVVTALVKRSLEVAAGVEESEIGQVFIEWTEYLLQFGCVEFKGEELYKSLQVLHNISTLTTHEHSTMNVDLDAMNCAEDFLKDFRRDKKNGKMLLAKAEQHNDKLKDKANAREPLDAAQASISWPRGLTPSFFCRDLVFEEINAKLDEVNYHWMDWMEATHPTEQDMSQHPSRRDFGCALRELQAGFLLCVEGLVALRIAILIEDVENVLEGWDSIIQHANPVAEVQARLNSFCGFMGIFFSFMMSRHSTKFQE